MITHLSGTLIEKIPPFLVVDVAGVGYELEAPMTTFYRLPEAGAPVSIYTHLVVREDAHVLFGFGSRDERTLFRALIKVNGVGPKVALAILSGMETPQFIRCITTHDTSSLVRIPGIGRKTAERLIVEMQDRLPPALGSALNPGQPMLAAAVPPSPQDARSDAESALISLGYKPQEASKAVSAIDATGLRSEEIIRLALRGMVRAS